MPCLPNFRTFLGFKWKWFSRVFPGRRCYTSRNSRNSANSVLCFNDHKRSSSYLSLSLSFKVHNHHVHNRAEIGECLHYLNIRVIYICFCIQLQQNQQTIQPLIPNILTSILSSCPKQIVYIALGELIVWQTEPKQGITCQFLHTLPHIVGHKLKGEACLWSAVPHVSSFYICIIQNIYVHCIALENNVMLSFRGFLGFSYPAMHSIADCCYVTLFNLIGNFRVAFRLCFKANPSAKPFIWKLVLFTCKSTTICVRIKLISMWKASH